MQCTCIVNVFLTVVLMAITNEQLELHINLVRKQIHKVFPANAIKAYTGSRGIAPVMLNLGMRWR
jgi:hypothetical protein